MNNLNFYDQFSENYDRFVNWDARLALELPFLTAELASLKNKTHQKVTVLDAACGTGQHVIALAEQGFDCTGADFSAKMIEIAQDNAHLAGHNIPFKQAGFGELVESFGSQAFDGLICLGNSLPHVLNEAMMMNTLSDFKSVLRPGGKIIIQNRNFDYVIKERNRWMEPQTYREGDKAWIFTRFYDFDPDGRITFNIVTLSNQDGGEFQQHIVSTRLWPLQQAQLVDFLERAGFNKIRLYGDLQGAAFEVETSGNLVIEAQA